MMNVRLEPHFMSREENFMPQFAIGEIARRANVPTSTIRYYERIGLLPPSARVNGKRRYDTTILQKLNVIKLAQRAGLTIAEIQMLVHGFPAGTPPSQRWQALAGDKIAELDALLEEIQNRKALLASTLQCQCPTLDDCAAGVT
jgi:MerR family transcriptional regulator, redox-sensitive transcriptional activator SoxR